MININLDELNQSLNKLDKDLKQFFEVTDQKVNSTKAEVKLNLDELNQGLNKLDKDLKQFFEVTDQKVNSTKAKVKTVNKINNLKQRLFELHGIAFKLRSQALELRARIEYGTYTALELDNLAMQVVELKLDIDELRREIHKL